MANLFEDIIAVSSVIGLKQQYFPIMFIAKQCYGSVFGKMLRKDVSNSLKLKDRINLITVTADKDANACPVQGSQATIFLYAWMRQLPTLYPTMTNADFNVKYVTDDTNSDNFAHRLQENPNMDPIVDFGKMAKGRITGTLFPVQCRAVSPGSSTVAALFDQLPVSVFGQMKYQQFKKVVTH